MMHYFLKYLTLCSLFLVAVPAFPQSNLLDLRGEDFSEQIIELSANWQMEFGAFLQAEEMRALEQPHFSSVPNTWTGQSYKGETLPSTGYATYYLRVLVDSSLSDLAIDARITSTNYRLYVNGEFLGELGKVGTSRKEAEPKYTNIIYQLPAHKGVIDIVYHVSNFHYRKGGMWRAPILGERAQLMKRKAKKIAISFFLLGAILFMGLYHVGMNLFRFKSPLAYNFAIVCFLTIFRTLSVGEFVLTEFLHFPWWLSTRVEFISFFLLIGYTARFIYSMFPYFIPQFYKNKPLYVSIVASVLTVIPIVYSSWLIPVMQVFTIAIGISLLYFIVKQAIKGDKEVLVALAGFIMLFSVVIIEILIHHSKMVGDVVFASGIFLYLFSHVVIMANRLNKTYENNEALGVALQKANTDLEAKVRMRTKQLDAQNEELKASNEELVRINREKDGLVHVVAHDLKSPLNTNIGLIELIKMHGNLNEEQELFIQNMEKSNSQGLSLINDLLILYQFESDRSLNVVPINVEEFLEQMVRKHNTTAKLKNITFTHDLDVLTDAFYTDEGLLTRILDNLFSNAVKFSYSDSQIYFRVKADDRYLYFEIKDSGMGILEKEQHLVFKKFAKISNRPTGNETSSGLGLSIVKELVSKMGGSIGFESKPTKGSTFWVDLPNLKDLYVKTEN